MRVRRSVSISSHHASGRSREVKPEYGRTSSGKRVRLSSVRAERSVSVHRAGKTSGCRNLKHLAGRFFRAEELVAPRSSRGRSNSTGSGRRGLFAESKAHGVARRHFYGPQQTRLAAKAGRASATRQPMKEPGTIVGAAGQATAAETRKLEPDLSGLREKLSPSGHSTEGGLLRGLRDRGLGAGHVVELGSDSIAIGKALLKNGELRKVVQGGKTYLHVPKNNAFGLLAGRYTRAGAIKQVIKPSLMKHGLKSAARGLGKTAALSVLGTAADYAIDGKADKILSRDFAVDATVDLGVGIASAKAGAIAGAAIGSIVPGAGTVIGGVVGAAVGLGVGLLINEGLDHFQAREWLKERAAGA